MRRENVPTGRIFPRDPAGEYPIATRAKGIRIELENGREVIDADSGAIAVISVGHGVEEVADAIAEQARTLAYVQDLQFTCDATQRLMDEIIDFLPDHIGSGYFVSSGADAVETALKLARQYHSVRGDWRRTKIISRWNSFHGNTLATLSLSGMPSRRAPYLPMLIDSPKIEPPNCYRCPFGMSHPSCGLRCADDLETEILRCGPEYVAAFIAEPIGGAASGCVMPPPGYYERIEEICHKYGVLFIADEIISCFGRTGKAFGIDHWQSKPDIMIAAKGIAGGYAPLGAVLVSNEIHDTFVEAGHAFAHAYTYSAHPVAAAAGASVLKIIKRDKLVAAAAERGRQLFIGLEKLRRFPFIGDIRGAGMLAGVELVADRESKRPFDPELGVAGLFRRIALEAGVAVYPVSGLIDGRQGDLFICSPPLVATEKDVDEIIDHLESSCETLSERLGL